jgi:hypothetical protein
MPRQTIPLAGHDLGQTLPAFKRENPLADFLAPLRVVSGFKERGGIVFDRATHNHFHVVHAVTLRSVNAGRIRLGRRIG